MYLPKYSRTPYNFMKNSDNSKNKLKDSSIR